MYRKIKIGRGVRLALEDCVDVARNGYLVMIAPETLRAMNKSRKVLLRYIEDRLPIYGVNTQFGNQVNFLDPHLHAKNKEEYLGAIRDRQLNIIKSHNCGVGDEVSIDIVRATMLLRAHCLALGYSGVRIEVIESLTNLLNKKVHPVIFKYGSIGASGDLIPLSAIASAAVGGSSLVDFRSKRLKAEDVLKLVRMQPLRLEGREGLALINGTSFMTSISLLAVYDLRRLFFQLLSAIAMSLETLMVFDSAYDPLLHRLKGHRGETEVNNFLLDFWKNSRLIRKLEEIRKEERRHFKRDSGPDSTKKLQDFYSLRSVPHGFGPFKENLERASEWVESEINSVNDNPVIGAASVFHGANFMGYYITSACDILKSDIAQASSWLHAILANLVHPRKNLDLPFNLMRHPEVHNGFRPLQILAAALAVQNRKLAQNHQSFMLPTEGDNQDVNSLGTHAAFDLREAVQNLEKLVAIVFLAATQALDLRGVRRAGKGSREIHKKIRKVSSFIDKDRDFREDIEAVLHLMRKPR